MTAVNIIRRVDAVCMITDGKGVAYEAPVWGQTMHASGKTIGVSKISILPHLGLAFAVRGLSMHRLFIEQAMAGFGESYDELKRRCVDLLFPWWQQGAAQWKAAGMGEGAAEADICFAGLSGGDRPDSFIVPTHGRYPGIEPWSVVDPGPLFMGPLDSSIHQMFEQHVFALDADMTSIAVEMVEAQMNLSALRPDGSLGKGSDDIGTFVQITTIRPSGITTAVVHRFPDNDREAP